MNLNAILPESFTKASQHLMEFTWALRFKTCVCKHCQTSHAKVYQLFYAHKD
ncbi:MAG: hypothetical protein VXY77_00415 [Pseudomonadota bacterium]|nr:hypothetical protein [Pseudomonadota bacterium]